MVTPSAPDGPDRTTRPGRLKIPHRVQYLYNSANQLVSVEPQWRPDLQGQTQLRLRPPPD